MLSQNGVEFAAQLGGDAGAAATGGDGDLHVAAVDARGHDEVALLGGIGHVGEDAASFGGDTDVVVHGAVVGGGEDEQVTGEIGGAEGAAVDAHGERVEVGKDIGGDDGDARAGFEEALRFAQRDLSRADDEN